MSVSQDDMGIVCVEKAVNKQATTSLKSNHYAAARPPSGGVSMLQAARSPWLATASLSSGPCLVISSVGIIGFVFLLRLFLHDMLFCVSSRLRVGPCYQVYLVG